ncbi:hypothetical protein GQ54DRAFT_242197, partial [Martensiomyces pterosporus]
MAARSIYTGRANGGTLTSTCVGGEIYIAYASGQEIVVHGDATQYVQSLTHSCIRGSVAVLAASESGQLAAISGSSIAVFKAAVTDRGNRDGSVRAKVRWEYSSHIDVTDACPSACEWLGETKLLVGAGDKLSLWVHSDSAWTEAWTRTTGGRTSAISAAPDGTLFATAAHNSRMVKVWRSDGCDSSGDSLLRFQYLVHPTAVRDMFWRRHQATPDDQARDSLTLYTVTRDGRFNAWCSAHTSGSTQLPTADSGAKLVLISAIDLAQANVSHGLSPTRPRRLVAARILETPRPERCASETPAPGPEEDTQHASSDTSFTEPESLPVPNGNAAANDAAQNDLLVSEADSECAERSSRQQPAADRGALSNSKPPQGPRRLSRDSRSRRRNPSALRHVPLQRPLSADFEHVYSAYDDGSLELWEIRHSAGAFGIPSVDLVLRTPAIRTTFPLAPAVGHSGVLMPSLLWQSKPDPLRLALVDAVGHVYLFSVPDAASKDGQDAALCLDGLWDGHKEPIFHISVDPYSQHVATHSVEGELLIWDTVTARRSTLSISRKMGLDGSQIRTIAWAPTESEFIGATDKRVYRLAYDSEAEQWSPCNTNFPQMSTYDHIFTYPAGSAEDAADAAASKAYYITTIEKASKTARTWRVAGPRQSIEFVDKSVLTQAAHFDRASRVMPVAHPFFSRDNIMATFDTNSGHMRIWGIRTSPRFMWFCSKKHRLPCMDAKMIRYNSIDKAAIVSVGEDGSQVITIWVFSSASRASHYLPAGTIYPRNKADRVREIRWYLTDYAQSYLGIQWDDRIDVYCQERNLDDAWLCIFTIPSSDFGPGQDIGSFSFTAAGEPTFSVGRKLVVYAQNLPDGKRISDAAFEEHGELPFIHPFVLTELMSWGQLDAVKQLLARLYDYMRERDIDAARDVALPMISLEELIAADPSQVGEKPANPGQRASNVRSRYSSLFDTEMDSGDAIDGSANPDFGGFSNDKAEFIIEKLAEIKIKGMSPLDQARLMSIVGTISVSLVKDQPIDSMGIRYLTKLQLLELENKRTRSASELAYRELNWAMHSNSQAILLQLCLQQYAASGLTWESARRMGIFTWLSDISAVRSEIEKMARNIFVAEGRDPSKCAIFFLALKKQRLLLGLWRTAHNHPEQNKMLAFLSHDFSEAKWKTAAAKNAYVLLSRQRYLDAATFFMLSGKLADAATVCIAQLNDVQLAVAICRCYEGDNGPVLRDILWRHILPDAFNRQDRWLASLAFGITH